MAEQARCPQCGKPLSDKLLGLCPECMLRAGLATEATGEADKGFVPPAVDVLQEHFPQLEILELIGRGGMGAVYRARQKSLDRVVALKILPPGVASDTAFAERFAREAKALAAMSHPNIVTLYEFGEARGLYYFLMEFIDGVNLRQLMAARRVEPKEALAIVPQICDALQYAHERGIVHRDIKPENVLLSRDGVVKIADFGVAKIVGRAETRRAESGNGDAVATDARVVGTPAYMAPEQKDRPAEVDHRADIYSLGVVFYQMLTGELPGKRIEAPSRRVQIDVRLDEVVLKAMDLEPERRYETAGAMKTVVETIAEEQVENAKPSAEIVMGGEIGGQTRWTMLRQTMSRLVAVAAMVAMLCSLLAFLSLAWLNPSYTATGFLVLQMTEGPRAVNANSLRTELRRHVATMQEPTILETAMAALKSNPQANPPPRLNPAQLAVTAVPDTKLIRVSYTDTDPRRAATAAEAVMTAYCATASSPDQTLSILASPNLPIGVNPAQHRLFVGACLAVIGAALGAAWWLLLRRKAKRTVEGDIAQGPGKWVVISTIVVHALSVLAFLAFLMLIVPRLESVFKEFGADLPRVAMMTLALPHWIDDHGVLLILVLGVMLALDIGICLALQALGRRGGLRWPARLWSVMVPAVLGILVTLGLFSLLMAAVSLIQAVTSKPAAATPAPVVPPAMFTLAPAPALAPEPVIPSEWVPQVAPADWRYIVIHHSDTESGNAAVFDKAHRERGWESLIYHFVIDNGNGSPDGKIEVGTRWTKQQRGAHTGTPDHRYNNFGIGICLVGNFDKGVPTEAQYRALVELAATLSSTYHIDPQNIIGHNEAKATACPGKNLSIKALREDVIRVVADRQKALPAPSSQPIERAPTPVSPELMRARKEILDLAESDLKRAEAMFAAGLIAAPERLKAKRDRDVAAAELAADAVAAADAQVKYWEAISAYRKSTFEAGMGSAEEYQDALAELARAKAKYEELKEAKPATQPAGK